MDLTSPLRTLAPSLDSAVLEVLVGTESGLSAVQVARLSRRGTRTGQRPVLDRLTEHGLVIADRANTGYLYRFNREHLLAPAVLAATNARSELMSRMRTACLELDPEPVHASVYGSFARGEAGPESDIDMMLVVPDDVVTSGPPWTDQVQALQLAVQAWTGNRLEPLVLSMSRLATVADVDEPIIGTWSEDAITLVGPEPAALIARAQGGGRRT